MKCDLAKDFCKINLTEISKRKNIPADVGRFNADNSRYGSAKSAVFEAINAFSGNQRERKFFSQIFAENADDSAGNQRERKYSRRCSQNTQISISVN